jgi:hypothetical protein
MDPLVSELQAAQVGIISPISYLASSVDSRRLGLKLLFQARRARFMTPVPDTAKIVSHNLQTTG